MNSDYILNIMDATDFPDLPVKDLMHNNLNIVLSENQCIKLEDLKITLLKSKK